MWAVTHCYAHATAFIPFPPVLVQDDQGRNVKLSRPSQRAITLAPHITELVYAAGAGAYLVGTVASSNFPLTVQPVTKIGDGLQIDIERLSVLQPDLILAWQPAVLEGLQGIWQKLGTATFYSDPRRLQDIPNTIEKLGIIFNTSKQAHDTALIWRARLDALKQRYANTSLVRVFIQIGKDPLYTLNGSSIMNDALHVCGGINIFADVPVLAPQVDLESVLTRQPDAIIFGYKQKTEYTATVSTWRHYALTILPQLHVYGIDADILYRPGPRLLEATEKLCQYLEQVRQSKL